MSLPRVLSAVLLSSLLFAPLNTVFAQEPEWRLIAYRTSASLSRKAYAKRQHELFEYFLATSLTGQGRKDFMSVADDVKNNITWRGSKGKNIYIEAFKRSWPFVGKVDLQGMPDTILLIPYMESLWNGKKGKPSSDYGYWQLVREVVEEIQTLDYAPKALRAAHPDKVRSDADLSTKAAQIHLRRYYFYFAKVAGFPENDAWLLAITAYNWGAGNVKRMLAEMEGEGMPQNFSSFYQYLYARQQKNPADRSIRAAVEYLPSLWNIAQLIDGKD